MLQQQTQLASGGNPCMRPQHQLFNRGQHRPHSSAVSVAGWQQRSRFQHASRETLVRSAPEKVQEQEVQTPTPAPPPGVQFVRAEAITTIQEEQERELKTLTTELPKQEARFEWLAFWVASAVAFGAGIWYVEGSEKAQEFFAGYLLEQSLSIDNLFVFVLVFNYFKTPLDAQPKVLSYGIITAAVLRLVMILLGVELIQKFQPLLVVFAGVLLWSAYGLLTKGDEDDDDDLSDNAVVKLCRSVLPVSDHYEGVNFFTTPAAAAAAAAAAAGAAAGNGGSSSSSSSSGSSAAVVRSWGGRVATPLLLALAVVEISDVLFAVDSIPAVFGVTLDPFVIYTSNMFAIFSLRSLYSFVSTVMTELRYLDKAVALVLAFIGAKMLLEFADIQVPTDVSLLVVGLMLGGGVGASMLLPEPEDDKKA